jgi:hypothetical protein
MATNGVFVERLMAFIPFISADLRALPVYRSDTSETDTKKPKQ